MSLQELERAVASLSPGDLGAFAEWFEEYLADAWNRQIEQDALSAGAECESGAAEGGGGELRYRLIPSSRVSMIWHANLEKAAVRISMNA
jgi:hypothetical protein